MSNPPKRPWLRLGSLARIVPTAGPAQPRPPLPRRPTTFIRPAVASPPPPLQPQPQQPQTLAPPPQGPPAAASSSSRTQPPSPPPSFTKPATELPSSRSPALRSPPKPAAPSPPPLASSPMVVQVTPTTKIGPATTSPTHKSVPSEQPKPKPVSAKLSPISPPSDEREPTRKKGPISGKINSYQPNDHGMYEKPKKESWVLVDSGIRSITIAGDNKGAVMKIIQSPQNGSPKALHKTEKSRVFSHSRSDEGEHKNKKKNPDITLPMRAFMNSNVQGINNSTVYNSSSTHHDPGVHLTLSRRPVGNGFHVKDRGDGHRG